MNSSPDLATAGAFVRTSLALLRQEYGDVYFLLCRRLAPRALLLVIDGEEIPLRFTPFEIEFPAALPRPRVRCQTSSGAILDVIDARLTLNEAVAAGRLILVGDTADLSLFHDGLIDYVRGMVRAPSAPFLLERFRRFAEVRPDSP